MMNAPALEYFTGAACQLLEHALKCWWTFYKYPPESTKTHLWHAIPVLRV